jgi:dTDP-4-dehydrorhamnose reductase
VSRTLVFGAGWVGTTLRDVLPGVVLSTVDVADPAAVEREIVRVRPDRVVNAAGKTGRPNVDSLEADPEGTRRSNVTGPVVLATACRRRDLHFTHFGTGCVYVGDNGGRGFSEEDPPTFTGSLYARTKIEAERALRPLGALQLRLRLPTSSVPHPRNLLTKLLGFRQVVSVPNSITVLDDAWGAITALIERGETGVWNVVNEGVERHDEFLGLWRRLVDPTLAVDVVPVETLRARLVAPRSDCILSTEKLRAAGLGLPPLPESLPRVVRRYALACGTESDSFPQAGSARKG